MKCACLIFFCSLTFHSAEAWVWRLPENMLNDPLKSRLDWSFNENKEPELEVADRPFFGYVNHSIEHFFYKGDTARLNKFLLSTQNTAKLIPMSGWYSSVDLKCVMHTGVSHAGMPWDAGKDAKDRSQWKMVIVPNYHVDREEKQVRQTLTVNIHVWIDEKIDLEKLIVPEQFEVLSGGEIEKFIEARPTVHSSRTDSPSSR